MDKAGLWQPFVRLSASSSAADLPARAFQTQQGLARARPGELGQRGDGWLIDGHILVTAAHAALMKRD